MSKPLPAHRRRKPVFIFGSGNVAFSEPNGDLRNQKRFMGAPARRLTTYDRALQSARNMAEHNGMTVRVMEVRETIYAAPTRKVGANGR